VLLLVDGNADLSLIDYTRAGALYGAMPIPYKESPNRVPGMPFAVLSCNTDSKNVRIDQTVTPAMPHTHQRVQAGPRLHQ
jgi:hypothetical protein